MDSQPNSHPFVHIPVLPSEILEYGNPTAGQTWIDGTAGAGGHSTLIAEAIGSTGRLISIDRDPGVTERLTGMLPEHVQVVHASYDAIPQILGAGSLGSVDGILLDLGLSSDQLADRQRGFSFQTDGKLDMRFDPTSGEPAYEWLARIDEETLANCIYRYGEERFSRRIARRIVESRLTKPVETASQLRDLIYSSVPGGRRASGGNRKHGRIDPATRTFQALRIVVNDELAILESTMESIAGWLKLGGVVLVISFHSLEDRIVKYAFREDARLKVVTRRPVQAQEVELQKNPRARSAKLRVARRIDSKAVGESKNKYAHLSPQFGNEYESPN